jgi:transcription-repair coupling factor (superfamily II helicase)
VPEARIRVAHGQMKERELERIMHRFVNGAFDVLLCTTIIESGLDIPNVNTILIDRADRFGVADLYQLRGRVGRYRRQAHAILLLPRHGRLFDTARRRIQALRRHGGLGAGLRVALQDLEIRGAGNVLGSAQSGHIAAVGFDLYCQLLQRTVARMRGGRVPPTIEARVRLDFLDFAPAPEARADSAMIPYGYVEDENHRLALYRRLAGAATGAQVRALRGELKDRFGPVPPAVLRLLAIARLRILAHAKGIAEVETRGDRLLLRRGGDWIAPGGRLPRLAEAEPTARLDEILRRVAAVPSPHARPTRR